MMHVIRQSSNAWFVVFLLVAFVFSFPLSAQDVPPRWDDSFGAFGVDGEVFDAVQGNDGQLYIAGDFRRVGGLQVNGVARWDGSNWHSLGQGIGQSSADIVYTLAFDSNGALIVGGDFFEVRQSNGDVIEVNNLAVWNGTQWDAVASGVNDIVYDLLPDDNGGMYIAGVFSSDGEDEFELNRIAYWDGGAFSSVGDGLGTFGGVVAHALAMDNAGTLFAAGTEFSGGIFQWDGQNWSAFGARHNGTILDMVIDDAGQIYAAGDFISVIQPDESTLSASRIALWTGTEWQALGTGFDQPVRALWLEGTSVYAGGLFTQSGDGGTDFHYIASWDGAWNPVGEINNPDAFEGVNVLLNTSEMGLLAGGSMQFMGNSLVNGIGFWQAGEWTGVGGEGADARVRAIHLTEAGALFIGGDFGFTGNTATNYVAQRVNGEWEPLGQGTDGDVMAIAMDNNGDLFVGGSFTNVVQSDGTEVLVYGIARWDGTAWAALGTGVNGDVEAIAIDQGGTVYIGGSFTQDGSEQSVLNYVAQWDGAGWVQVGGGMDAAVSALEIGAGNELVAGGAFSSAGSIANTSYLASWSNSAWSPLSAGTAVNGEVYALEVDAGGMLTVGGAFTEVSAGVAASHIAQWDGQNWTLLGSGLGNGTSNCCVRAVAAGADGSLFLGGEFTGVRRPAGPEIQANHIATWTADGGLLPLESGVDGQVRALALNSEDLFVGGDFLSANGFPSSHIGRWSSGVSYVSVEDTPDNVPGGISVTSLYPNPVSHTFHVRVAIDTPQSVQIDVYDLLGRKVDAIFDNYASTSGTMEVIVEAGHLAAGTYILRVQGETISKARTFVRTR